jgi:hypothetical protein
MKVINEGCRLDQNENQDGDFSVKWDFGDYYLMTSVIASNHEQALRFAEDKLPFLILEEKCEEVIITLEGIYN